MYIYTLYTIESIDMDTGQFKNMDIGQFKNMDIGHGQIRNIDMDISRT